MYIFGWIFEAFSRLFVLNGNTWKRTNVYKQMITDHKKMQVWKKYDGTWKNSCDVNQKFTN